MPIVRKAALVCDWCGAKQEFDPEVKDPLSMSSACRAPMLAGWAGVGGGKCLCPDCSALRKAIKDRHRAEMLELMGETGIELEV